jgi:hypothetical protein
VEKQRRRVTYANVMSTVAVVAVISGGTAIAATRLITGKDVKNSSLTGSDIRNGSLGVVDLSSAARTTLKGVPGQAGPAIDVRDAAGTVIGPIIDTSSSSANGEIYTVLRDGGLYLYRQTGTLVNNFTVVFTATDCSGAAYIAGQASPNDPPAVVTLATFSGPVRAVWRQNLSPGVFGPASAWKAHGTTLAIASKQLYARNATTGACAAAGAPFSGDLVLLDAVTPAPPDFAAPLSVG